VKITTVSYEFTIIFHFGKRFRELLLLSVNSLHSTLTKSEIKSHKCA